LRDVLQAVIVAAMKPLSQVAAPQAVPRRTFLQLTAGSALGLALSPAPFASAAPRRAMSGAAITVWARSISRSKQSDGCSRPRASKRTR